MWQLADYEENMTLLEEYAPGPASGAQVQKDGEKWTLILVRELRHPPEKVWQALIDPAHLQCAHCSRAIAAPVESGASAAQSSSGAAAARGAADITASPRMTIPTPIRLIVPPLFHRYLRCSPSRKCGSAETRRRGVFSQGPLLTRKVLRSGRSYFENGDWENAVPVRAGITLSP